MMNLLSDEMRRDPYPVYRPLRERSPLLFDKSSGLWMLFGYEDVKRALDDHEAFSSRAAPPGGKPLDWLIFSDPPQHSKLRALIMRAFTPRSVASLEPRIRELARELLEPAIARGEMDLAVDLAIPLPMMVIAEMLGIPIGERARFKRWSDVILQLSDAIWGGETAAKAGAEFRAAKIEMNDYLGPLLADRKAAPRDDLLTRLALAEVDGQQLTQEEILAFFQLLLLAGTETTTNLINNFTLTLIDHPDELGRLRRSPDLLPAAIEEVLRYRAPVQIVFRQTRRAVEMHRQVIPADALVFLVLGSANRDAAVFADADRFDITREPNAHLSFGRGVHFCVGAPLARLESRVALSYFLARTRRFARASAEPWEPRRAFHVHGPTRLPITVEPA